MSLHAPPPPGAGVHQRRDVPVLRADLHVHSSHSKENGVVPFLKSRDCYSSPEAVYRTAKARGMDLVTITDHDTIDGCRELLDRHPDAPDFIVGEEVSCRLPDADVEIHLGVYGISEALHRQLQPLRDNVFDVTAALREAGVFYACNHLLHFYRRTVPMGRYLALLAEMPALEVRNGTMLPEHNALVDRIARDWKPRGRDGRPMGRVAGSDAHTLRRIGRTWTEAPGRTRDQFIESLRNGLGRPAGAHGDALAVAGDTYGVVARYISSLVGAGPFEHGIGRRAGGLAFSLASLPFEFLPLAIAAITKRRERRHVALAWQALASVPDSAQTALEIVEAGG